VTDSTIVPWTVERYHRAVAAGLVPEDPSVELLDGFIVRKNRSTTGEDPITIGDRHRIAVLRLAHAAPHYLEHPPLAGDLVCVIEVADSSLSLDLGPKLRMYAAAGIPQYVVADLVNDRVVIHEEPAGDAYRRVTRVTPPASVDLRAGTGRVSLAAARLLPA
jgi:hypothetical protein